MSYSFNIRAATIADATFETLAKLDETIAQQPIHARDRAVTVDTVQDMLSLVEEPAEGQEVSVSVSGSCYGSEGKAFTGISLNVGIAVLTKTA